MPMTDPIPTFGSPVNPHKAADAHEQGGTAADAVAPSTEEESRVMRRKRREANANAARFQQPEDQLRAEDISRMTILPDTPDHVAVVNVGPSGMAGPSYTFEDRGGKYPHHPGGAYMPSDKDQAEAEEDARKARRANRD